MLNTLAVGAYAALINVAVALAVSNLLAPNFAIGVEIIDSIIAMLGTHASSTPMLIATSIIVAAAAMVAKMGANATVED